MAATSPYTQNDYQAVSNFRPYELPVNDIFKAISAQNQFWDQGAARVKAVYDNALGLKLTSNANIEVKKKFMEDAEKELTKLSSMNVADPSVQRQGFNIFKPLMKDKDIMYDNFLTDKREQIFAEAERYKLDEKTKGEGYDRGNLMFALMPFEGFNKDTQRGQIEGIYNKAKDAEYTPYHNFTKEMMDIAAKCPHDELEGNSMENLYFHKVKDSGQTKSGLLGCIKTSLSPKAWRQFNITGSILYGKDYKSIAESYVPTLKGNNLAYAQTILQYEAELKAKKTSPGFTPEIEKEYTDNISLLKRQMEENEASVTKLTSGDFSEIEKDYDKVIGMVYGNKVIDDFSTAYSYKKISDLYSADPAAIATQNLNSANYWKSKQYELDLKNSDIALLKALGAVGGDGNSSTTAGAGSATYEMMSQIRKRLGLPDNIVPFLDEGKLMKDFGTTIDQIDKSVKQYQNELGNKQDKLDFAITKIANKNGDVIQKAKSSGQYNSGKLNEWAEGIIRTYYDNFKGTVPDDEILELEEALDDYNKTSVKASHFLKMRDRINEEIDKDPKIKESIQSKSKWIEYTANNNKGKTGYDFSKKQWITFDKERLKSIYAGIDAEYNLGDDGLIYDRLGNNIGYNSNDKSALRMIGDAFSANYISNSNSVNQQKALKSTINTLNKEISVSIVPKVQDVVKNTLSYNVGSVQGLPENIRQQFSFIPEVAANQVKFVPTVAYEVDGELYTEVTSMKYDKDKKEWVDNTSDIKKSLKESSYSANSMLNSIAVKDGKLLVKTPYLPMASPSYQLKEVVDDLVYQTKNLTLRNGESTSIKVTNLVGGHVLGFDVIGGGIDANGNKNPVSYRPYIKNPRNEKQSIGVISATAEDLSNQLMEIEQQYYREKPYKKKQ